MADILVLYAPKFETQPPFFQSMVSNELPNRFSMPVCPTLQHGQ